MSNNEDSSMWYRKTPPTISSLSCADKNSNELLNFMMLQKCWDHRINPKQFTTRPTESMIQRIIINKKKDLIK